MKQGGAVLAKGRLLGLQFETLLQTDFIIRSAGTALNWLCRSKQLSRNAAWAL